MENSTGSHLKENDESKHPDNVGTGITSAISFDGSDCVLVTHSSDLLSSDSGLNSSPSSDTKRENVNRVQVTYSSNPNEDSSTEPFSSDKNKCEHSPDREATVPLVAKSPKADWVWVNHSPDSDEISSIRSFSLM